MRDCALGGCGNVFLVKLVASVQFLVALYLLNSVHLDLFMQVSHGLHLCPFNDHALILFLVDLLFEHADLGVEDGFDGGGESLRLVLGLLSGLSLGVQVLKATLFLHVTGNLDELALNTFVVAIAEALGLPLLAEDQVINSLLL